MRIADKWYETADERRFTQMDPMKIGVHRWFLPGGR
jgi:hypothetical protein